MLTIMRPHAEVVVRSDTMATPQEALNLALERAKETVNKIKEYAHDTE